MVQQALNALDESTTESPPATDLIGQAVQSLAKLSQMDATQKDLAMTSGTGLRFIIELEQGKPTCQVGKVLTVLNTLGIHVELALPEAAAFSSITVMIPLPLEFTLEALTTEVCP